MQPPVNDITILKMNCITKYKLRLKANLEHLSLEKLNLHGK